MNPTHLQNQFYTPTTLDKNMINSLCFAKFEQFQNNVFNDACTLLIDVVTRKYVFNVTFIFFVKVPSKTSLFNETITILII